MIEPEQGFSIDDVDHRWGVTPGGIAGIGPLAASSGYVHHDLRCRSALGFSAAGVTVSAPAADRPVMNVSYELAAPWLVRAAPERWMEKLRACFGPPLDDGRDDLRDYPDPSSGVAYWANWRRSTVEIGLSVYGGTRASQFGRSAGLLYIAWSDMAAAAAPFVAVWRAATAALARSAATISAFQRFEVPAALWPAGGPVGPHEASFEEWRALNSRALLATPTAIRERLSPDSFGLWRSGVDGRWALSTLWDTVVLGTAARVSWAEIRPAKGGGHSGLSVDDWSITTAYGTPGVAAAAAALKALPGIEVDEESGYDA